MGSPTVNENEVMPRAIGLQARLRPIEQNRRCSHPSQEHIPYDQLPKHWQGTKNLLAARRLRRRYV